MQFPSTANIGVVKMLMGALVLAMTTVGGTIDAATGAVLLPAGTSWMLIAGAVLYIAFSAYQAYQSRDRLYETWRTTAAGFTKATMAAITTILISQGIDVETGRIALSATTELWATITAIAYFALSGFQAYLTLDTDGETWHTTSVGVVKALSGIVATILLTLGVDVVGSTPIVQSELKTTAASVLYGVYLLGSTMQAFLTQKKLSFA